jgi:uroporphyrinogen-III decarboxylase
VDEIDPSIPLCATSNPVAVLYEGTPDDVCQAVEACRTAGGDNWLAMPGCEVPRGTRDENVLAMRDALAVN